MNTDHSKTVKDIKADVKWNKLRVARDRGDATPEVIAFCEKHLDEMADAVFKLLQKHLKKTYDFSETVKAVKADHELLMLVSKFEDDYEEVLKWNKLIYAKKFDGSITIHHREMDSALCDLISRKSRVISNDVYNNLFRIMYQYAHRNEPWPVK